MADAAPSDSPDTANKPRRPLQVALLVLLVLLAFGLVAVGASFLSRKGGMGQHGRPPAAISVAKAGRTDIPVVLNSIGTVQPLTTATVRTQIAGTLFNLFFTEGEMVREGAPLAQIDPRPYKLAVAESEANLARDKAQLIVARTELQRYELLLGQDSIARQQVDTQRATVGQLQGTVAADEAAIGTAKLNLAYTTIRAPIAGRVGIRKVDIGNYLTPSDTNGIVSITRLNPIDVRFTLPQANLSLIGSGPGAGEQLTAEAYDQNNAKLLATGHFLTLDNSVDPETGTVLAKARFPNAGNTLFPGEFVNIALKVTTLRGVTAVPVSAIRHGTPGDFVFTLQKDNTVKLVPVRTGPGKDGLTAVLSGLAAGANVVTEGADGLEDGAPVTLPGAIKKGRAHHPKTRQKAE